MSGLTQTDLDKIHGEIMLAGITQAMGITLLSEITRLRKQNDSKEKRVLQESVDELKEKLEWAEKGIEEWRDIALQIRDVLSQTHGEMVLRKIRGIICQSMPAAPRIIDLEGQVAEVDIENMDKQRTLVELQKRITELEEKLKEKQLILEHSESVSKRNGPNYATAAICIDLMEVLDSAGMGKGKFGNTMTGMVYEIVSRITDLESELTWFLVSERLPEKKEDIFVQVKCGLFYVATFNPLMERFLIHDTKKCSCDVIRWLLPNHFRPDRTHEECSDCALELSEPPECSGHVAGPVACEGFMESDKGVDTSTVDPD